ncbi:response regulator transcription factor [Undibacterium parvum]|uniref:Response regulator transcription factor n=1 Tax=Undibacterium parvum TaxID=401471 RepID=A0A3S5HM28_9BURK|nr:response regulator [Undibacterium parvum]AZP13766.1 response regulator transcription factor [Undibacterium parvum]
MNNMPAPLIHVIDDDAPLRTAMYRLLLACGYRVLTYESASEFIENPLHDELSCILLDVNMPTMSGFQLQEYLNKVNSHIPIVFLTAHGDISLSVRAMKAGAENFLSKPVQKDDLLVAIEGALEHYRKTMDESGNLSHVRLCYARLTAREIEVFNMVVRGQLNKQIAFQLGNSERTIKSQRSKVMEKMEVTSVAQLVLVAKQLGYI